MNKLLESFAEPVVARKFRLFLRITRSDRRPVSRTLLAKIPLLRVTDKVWYLDKPEITALCGAL